MPCRKHPVALEGGLCQICLLEEALAAPRAGSDGWIWPEEDHAESPVRRLTVQMPLGGTSAGAVYLVRQQAPVVALLRLKTWHQAAPPDFLERFARLQDSLARADEPLVVAPLAASVDAAGRPYILSDFRQGVPVLQAARTGALAADAAVGLARSLGEALNRLHTLGLAHGSVVPGNVLVQSGAWFIVDFGMSTLLGAARDVTELIARDLEGIAAIAAAMAASTPSPPGPPL